MRNVVDEIVEYLHANGEKKAFCDALPDKPDAAMAVYEYSAGEGAGDKSAGALGFLPRLLQLRFRAPGRKDALETAYRVFALLSSDPGERLVPLGSGGALILPKQCPALLERDSRGRAIAFFNVTVCC